ncbi:UDP-N-acetylmuramoyl-L-alanine--D-glutamate ligase [Sediminicurvatus halobius]|uniref:UDP-N-acetylmuramoylalanine--D-glutamate ligase n=1 Tax=Sediminicurvatus halobius TaxID=2182432 RepID=A0A2U2N857_9GAMM|nr:UDP-N-acetylmuramoyl-L-alanine--D-glutamate ligase [Spiribacter halobius]PWG65277.1 UDP-N-acetylmuramoyl-L-alanine--D-glutamate ligase [Spiribacter halobius]UEX78872.1 UDP-N-acetylmuramoyl-L-alanine--D-glutamate ligase [Spiribacter halobius]
MTAKRPGWDAVIVGLGETGLACARHLAARGRRVAVTDSRATPPRARALAAEHPEIPQALGRLDASLLADAGEIVLSPGVDPRLPELQAAREAGVPMAGEIELFARVARAPVVAITGSNGKSTVTSLVGAMAEAAGLRTAVGGNLGTPALDLLAEPESELYVLELSSFQLETVASLDARVATVLNLSPDHLDRYPDIAAYAAAKQRIFRGHGLMVLNADDPQVAAMALAGRERRWFGLGPPAGDEHYGLVRRAGETWLARGETPLLPTGALALPGRHNQANALAALALGEAAGLPEAAMLAALREFRGLPHRSEPVAERNGVLWVNDSKATNVGAAVAAIEGMERPVVLLAGGDGKGQDFGALATALRGRARAAVVFGRDAPRLVAALGDACPVTRVADLDAAVTAAAALSRAGDAVLLAPACASLDQFPDYRARGAAFRRAVEGLGDG